MIRADPVDVLLRVGGTASARDLVSLCGRSPVRTAVDRGSVVRVRHGLYALPEAEDPLLSAVRLTGVVSHESAAAHWGLWLPQRPAAPHVTVRRRGTRHRRGAVVLHWADLGQHEVVGHVTTPLRTVLDCARSSPGATALAVADSALRLELVGATELAAAAEGLRGAGRRRVTRIACWADGRSESVLESVLRAILLEAGFTCFDLQVRISEDGLTVRVDLADIRRRIVLEADSFEHHGHRAALVKDCRRYDELTVRGWRVLRFAWEQVMFEPDWVVDMVRRLVDTTPPRRGAEVSSWAI